METLRIKLKQHTPIIHFQHNQDGATLRATEVKPKLDRFIIEEAFNNDFEKCKEYLVGYPKDETNEKTKNQNEKILKEKFDKGFRALNYKMRIEAKELLKEKMPVKIKTGRTGERKYNTEYPLVICNLNKESVDEILNFSIAKDIEIQFFSKLNGIFAALNKSLLNDFFGIHNFGNRQNKGFGSFYLSEVQNESCFFSDYCYCVGDVFIEIEEEIKYKNLFYIIEYFWKTMKKEAMEGKLKNKISDAERIPSTIYFKPYILENVTKIFMICDEDLIEDDIFKLMKKKYPKLTFTVTIESLVIECKIKRF